MTLNKLAEIYRVRIVRQTANGEPCRDGDPIVVGRNGHLYVEGGRTFICFTDDVDGCDRRRKRPLTQRQKTNAIKRLGDGLIRMKQEGDFEFIAEIDSGWVDVALFRVLGVKRRKTVSPAVLAGLAVARDSRNQAKPC